MGEMLLGRTLPGILVLCLMVGTSWFHPSDVRAETGREKLRPWILVDLSPKGGARGGRRVFSVFKKLSGNPDGKIIHFSALTPELVADIQPEFVILGPQSTPWCKYAGKTGVHLQNFLWTVPYLVEEMNVPLLGICGGHQALAMAFGGRVGPVRAVNDDCLPYSLGRRKGTVPLTLEARDPIFQGMLAQIRIVESHFDEVKRLPPGFVLLASEKISRIQIMRHPSRPVYGIQGHPELFRTTRPDGGLLIRNFIKIARTHNRTMRQFAHWPPPRSIAMK